MNAKVAAVGAPRLVELVDSFGESIPPPDGRNSPLYDLGPSAPHYLRSSGENYDWRTGENPARWKDYFSNILPEPKKLTRGPMAAVHYDDVPDVFATLMASKAMSATALQFLILTAARSGEVREATWDEIDFEKRLWIVPKERMKANETHFVPLSNQALALVKGLSENKASPFIFPGQKIDRPMSDMTLTKLLRNWKVTAKVDGKAKNATAHGFRSSFRDWCGNTTDYPRELAEEALAHKLPSAVERAYRREPAIEKRRTIMQEWADFCGLMYQKHQLN